MYVIIQILSEHFIHTQEKTDLENDKNKQANKKLYKHLDGLQNVYSGMNQEGQFKEKTWKTGHLLHKSEWIRCVKKSSISIYAS